MRHAQAQRGGLDPQAGDGAAQGDGLQLGHHERHQAVRQRGVRQVLVGGHAAHHGGAGRRIDVQHPAERGDVQLTSLGLRRLIAEPEQVGGALGQPHLRTGRDGSISLLDRGHRGFVSLPHPGGKGLRRSGQYLRRTGGGGPAWPRLVFRRASGIHAHRATTITLRPCSATARVSHSASPRSGPARLEAEDERSGSCGQVPGRLRRTAAEVYRAVALPLNRCGSVSMSRLPQVTCRINIPVHDQAAGGAGIRTLRQGEFGFHRAPARTARTLATRACSRDSRAAALRPFAEPFTLREQARPARRRRRRRAGAREPPSAFGPSTVTTVPVSFTPVSRVLTPRSIPVALPGRA